ncbi:DNA-binding protein HU-beta [Alphaproteobacteria bacterium]|nr:DNA-binding protein HU-beta [Alphaproteobacteria bacterium]
MNKHDLMKAIAEKTEFSQGNVEKFLNGFVKVVTETLAKGEEVTLVGFGSFSRVERSARTGRDFKTGESTTVPAYRAVKFKPGKNLKEAVV